jgi:hypothetical protein
MDNNKNAIIILVVVALITVAVSGCTSTNKTSANTAATKIAFTNNGPTWFHFDAVIENLTMKDGTNQNYYVEGYMKPNGGSVQIDLSALAGYGNQQLPAGTTVRVMAWKGLFNPTASPATSNMDLNMQGWSNTPTPQSDDQKYNVALQNLPVNKLPSGITDNTITPTKDPSTLNNDELASQEPVFEEEIFTVDANGKVTMTFTQPATLCNIAAHVI